MEDKKEETILPNIVNNIENNENTTNYSSENDTDSQDSTDAEIFLTGNIEKDHDIIQKLLDGNDYNTESIGEDSKIDKNNDWSVEMNHPTVSFKDINISETTPIIFAGNIKEILDNSICVITADTNSPVLDLDSLICFNDRSIVGRVNDLFGPVTQAFYTIYLPEEIDRERIQPGTPVYSVSQYSKHILPNQINEIKQSQPIFDDDQEEEFYSDDEKEKEATSKKKLPEKTFKQRKDKYLKKNQKQSNQQFQQNQILQFLPYVAQTQPFLQQQYLPNFQYQQPNYQYQQFYQQQNYQQQNFQYQQPNYQYQQFYQQQNYQQPNYQQPNHQQPNHQQPNYQYQQPPNQPKPLVPK